MSYPRVKHFLAAATAPLHGKQRRVATQLPELATPQKTDVVVFFSPHPDDETIFAGGYLISAVAAGAAVYVVLATDGNKRGLAGERLAEFQKATRLLGIKPQNLSYYLLADGALSRQRHELGEAIQVTLKQYAPTIVVAPHPADTHQDHRILGEAVAEKASCTLLQYLGHYPPRYPWPRKHLPQAKLLPPPKLKKEAWHAYTLAAGVQQQRHEALQAYQRELKTPTLRSLLLACDRTNELFVVHP